MSNQPTERLSLLPCPFCGSTDIDATGWASLLKVGPVCNGCGACADSPERWNRRATAPTGFAPGARDAIPWRATVIEDGGARIVTGTFPPSTEPEAKAGFFLPLHCINKLQHRSILKSIEQAKHAHYTNLSLRINGEIVVLEADWVKSMVEVPQSPGEPAERHGADIGILYCVGCGTPPGTESNTPICANFDEQGDGEGGTSHYCATCGHNSDCHEPVFPEYAIRQFCGYLSAAIPELHQIHPERVWRAWEGFLKKASSSTKVSES